MSQTTPRGTSILNTATVASVSIDPAPENNSAFALTTVYVGGPSADIEVQKILVVGAEPGGLLGRDGGPAIHVLDEGVESWAG